MKNGAHLCIDERAHADVRGTGVVVLTLIADEHDCGRTWLNVQNLDGWGGFKLPLSDVDEVRGFVDDDDHGILAIPTPEGIVSFKRPDRADFRKLIREFPEGAAHDTDDESRQRFLAGLCSV